MKKSLSTEPELSRPLRIEKITPNGVDEMIHASEAERKALAQRFDLVELVKLDATLNVRPERAGLNFLVHGNLKADVIQNCVVTLDPLPAHVEKQIEVHFGMPEHLEGGDTAERDLEEDDLEP